jgi:hypothetical protein
MVDFVPIRIIEWNLEKVLKPCSAGAPESALVNMSFRLSGSAPSEWADYFVDAWMRSSWFEGVSSPQVVDDKVLLNGTTLDQLTQIYKRLLRIGLEEANQKYIQFLGKGPKDRSEAERATGSDSE